MEHLFSAADALGKNNISPHYPTSIASLVWPHIFLLLFSIKGIIEDQTSQFPKASSFLLVQKMLINDPAPSNLLIHATY